MEKVKKDKPAWEKMKTANVLGLFVAFFSFLFLFMLLWVPVPEENIQIVSIIVGFVIGTGFSGLVAYFFNYRKEKDVEVFEAYGNCVNCGKAIDYKDDFK